MHTLERNRPLTLDDIADQRAYERERAEFGQHVRARKDRRRVPVGDLITFTFECADTIRYQIQEMARVERQTRDEQIQEQLDAYNPLIPTAGHLSATMFIELTSQIDLQHWLPLLVGVERAVHLRLADGSSVPGRLESDHESHLTRSDITSSVHYLQFAFTPEQLVTAAAGAMTLVVDHANYQAETTLSDETLTELRGDLLD